MLSSNIFHNPLPPFMFSSILHHIHLDFLKILIHSSLIPHSLIYLIFPFLRIFLSLLHTHSPLLTFAIHYFFLPSFLFFFVLPYPFHHRSLYTYIYPLLTSHLIPSPSLICHLALLPFNSFPLSLFNYMATSSYYLSTFCLLLLLSPLLVFLILFLLINLSSIFFTVLVFPKFHIVSFISSSLSPILTSFYHHHLHHSRHLCHTPYLKFLSP